MYQGQTLQELSTTVSAINTSKRDFLADTKTLEMRPIFGADGQVKNTGIYSNQADLNFPSSVQPHAHKQIAQRLGIGTKYYNKLLQNYPDLLCQNVNTLFQNENETRYIRCLDTNLSSQSLPESYDGVRAILSSRYRQIDNHLVLQTVMPVLYEQQANYGMEIKACEVNANSLYVKALFPKIESEVVKGDIVQAGVCIKNSEIGTGRFEISLFFYRLACTNGMVVQDKGHRNNHSGRDLSNDEHYSFFQEDTTKAIENAFSLQTRDKLKALINPSTYESALLEMSQSAERKFEGSPQTMLQEVTKKLGMSEKESADSLLHLMSGGIPQNTDWGIANAITRTAEDAKTMRDATRLEKSGYEVVKLGAESIASKRKTITIDA